MNHPGVELIIDNGNYIRGRTSCSCESPEHSLTIELEYDRKFKISSLLFLVQTELIHRSFKDKIRDIWRILRGKSVTYTGEFFFKDIDHVNDFINFLEELRDQMNKKYE
ncbi:MAG: hypothetical protein ACOCRX_07225 [Candidatus Woesearchaeota archaeon]